MSRPALGELFAAIGYKTYTLRKRYLLNTVVQIGIIYVLFLFVFLGGQAVAPAAVASNLEGLIVGFFVWVMAVRAYRALSQDLIREAQWGTLEQLYLTPFGFGKVMVVQTAVNVLEAFSWGATILVLLLVTTQEALHLSLFTVASLVALTVASAVGVGFVLGGLALVYKRIESLFTLVQFLFVGFISAPLDDYPALAALPLALGTDLLGRAMSEGVPLWELPTASVALLVGKAFVYLVGGFLAFRYATELARQRGVLGHH